MQVCRCAAGSTPRPPPPLLRCVRPPGGRRQADLCMRCLPRRLLPQPSSRARAWRTGSGPCSSRTRCWPGERAGGAGSAVWEDVRAVVLGVGSPRHQAHGSGLASCSRCQCAPHRWRLTCPVPSACLPAHPSRRGLPATPIVYNSVLAACEAACQLEAALDVLDEMRVGGVPRDQYTYSTLISCCYRVSGRRPGPPTPTPPCVGHTCPHTLCASCVRPCGTGRLPQARTPGRPAQLLAAPLKGLGAPSVPAHGGSRLTARAGHLSHRWARDLGVLAQPSFAVCQTCSSHSFPPLADGRPVGRGDAALCGDAAGGTGA